MTTSTLVLLRHGQSKWNLENRFTGFYDAELSDQGIKEAKEVGSKLKDISFDCVLTSTQQRAYNTACLALTEGGKKELIQEIKRFDDLRERNYGDLMGKNKDEARAEFGEEQVHIWRRSYDTPPPNGEALKDVVENRVRPCWNAHIKPLVNEGKNILIAAHGNSIRAMLIVLGLETPESINAAEIPTGGGVILTIKGGEITDRKIL